MPTHNELIQSALLRGVRAGTVLQDAVMKVRHARQKSREEFEIALGELFVLSSDAFKARNAFRAELKRKNEALQAARAEIRELKERRQ